MGRSARGDINLLGMRGVEVMLWIQMTEESNWRVEARRGIDDCGFSRFILFSFVNVLRDYWEETAQFLQEQLR